MKQIRGSEDGRWLLGVDDEGDVMVFETGKERVLQKKCEVRVNDGLVREVMVNSALMAFGVVSEKGTCSLFSLFDGSFLRSIHSQGAPFTWGMIAHNRTVLLYSASTYLLTLYSFEGEALASKELLCEPLEMRPVFDGRALLLTDNRTSSLIWVNDLCKWSVSKKHERERGKCDSTRRGFRGELPSRARCTCRSGSETRLHTTTSRITASSRR